MEAVGALFRKRWPRRLETWNEYATRIRDDVESDWIRFRRFQGMLFFLLVREQSDERIKRPWKNDYNFDELNGGAGGVFGRGG